MKQKRVDERLRRQVRKKLKKRTIVTGGGTNVLVQENVTNNVTTGVDLLSALQDVNLTDYPADGDTLVYDSASQLWVNEQPTGGGGGNFIASDGNTTLSSDIQVERAIGGQFSRLTINHNNISLYSDDVVGGSRVFVDRDYVDFDAGGQVLRGRFTQHGLVLYSGTPATGDVYYRDANGVLYPLPIGTAGQVLTVDTGLPSWETPTGGGGGGQTLGANFEGLGGTVVLVNSIVYLRAKAAMTITGWSIIAEGSSPTCTIDIFKIASGTTLPTASICASALPALTTGNALKSTTLTGWTTSVTADDMLAFKVTACANATKINIVLYP